MPAAGKVLAVIFLVSMMPSVSVQQLDCGPGAEAVEKSQHTLTCEGLQADGTVYWSKHDRILGKITIASCDATGFCQTNFSTRYDVKRPNNVTSTLKILDVKRDETFVEGEWSCFSNSTEYGSCYVTVVFLPHMAECEVGFDEQSGLVTGRCEMYKVYPGPTCNWYEHVQGHVTDIPRNQTSLTLTQYVDTFSSQIYFRATCHLKRPLPVTAGRYVYKSLILPGLVEPPVVLTTTDIVALPARPVLRNCPQDYVTNADNNSCTCVTSYLGSPQGSLAWFDPDNKIVVRSTSLILALPFSSVTAEFIDKTYTCGVVHHTGSVSVEYVPKIAAPPNKPKLSGIDKNQVYDVGATIKLECSADGGRPDITRVILECPGRPDEKDNDVGGSVISRLSFTLQESHRSGECVCSATNGFLTSETVTLAVSDILISDKGGKLELWQVIAIAVAGVVFVAIIAAVIAARKYRRSQSEPAADTVSACGEQTPIVQAAVPPDTSSNGDSEATRIPQRDKKECGFSESGGACGSTEPNMYSASGSSAPRAGKGKKTSGPEGLHELSLNTSPKHHNPYGPLPERNQREEHIYDRIGEYKRETVTKQCLSTPDRDNDSQQQKGLDDDTTKEIQLQSVPTPESLAQPEDKPSDPQPPVHPASSAYSQPAGQNDRSTGTEKGKQLTQQQPCALSNEHETRDNVAHGDGESDIPKAQSRGVVAESVGAQGEQASESPSQQEAGQQNSGGAKQSINQSAEERGKQTETNSCVSAETGPSPQRETSSTESAGEHQKANNSEENSPGNTQPEQSYQDPSIDNKDGSSPGVPKDEHHSSTHF